MIGYREKRRSFEAALVGQLPLNTSQASCRTSYWHNAPDTGKGEILEPAALESVD